MLYNKENQPYVGIYNLPLGPPQTPTSNPPTQVITEHRAELLYHTAGSHWLSSEKNLQTVNARDGIEKREPSCTVSGNVD